MGTGEDTLEDHFTGRSPRSGPSSDRSASGPENRVVVGEPASFLACHWLGQSTPRHAMFDRDTLEGKFARIGARMKLADGTGPRRRLGVAVALDVRSDRRGEFFEVIRRADAEAEVEVLDVQAADRHLLLLVRDRGEKSKFLCGHDERHWFVAAVPESAPVGTVRAAKEALKPAEVRAAQARAGLGVRAGNRRKNAANRRQGEWFFIPAPDLKVDEKLILHDEPITRGNGGKPHRVDCCYRTGGETVHVCRQRPNGIDGAAHRTLLESQPEAKNWGWRVMQRNAEVYVRGRDPSRRPPHDHAPRLAPGLDEHREPVQGHAPCGLPGLRGYPERDEAASRWSGNGACLRSWSGASRRAIGKMALIRTRAWLDSSLRR